MANPSPTQVTVSNLRSPPPFHGNAYEDAEDWLEELERVASANGWSANVGEKLAHVYFSLLDGARTWFTNREGNWSSWEEFTRKFLDTFASSERRKQAQRNETVAMFVEDMARLFRRADTDMSEGKKLGHLMRGVNWRLFAGLVRNPPKNVNEFLKESTAIERALQLYYRQYDRISSGVSTSAAAVPAVPATD